jgi:hypothetical protein
MFGTWTAKDVAHVEAVTVCSTGRVLSAVVLTRVLIEHVMKVPLQLNSFFISAKTVTELQVLWSCEIIAYALSLDACVSVGLFVSIGTWAAFGLSLQDTLSS